MNITKVNLLLKSMLKSCRIRRARYARLSTKYPSDPYYFQWFQGEGWVEGALLEVKERLVGLTFDPRTGKRVDGKETK